MILPIALEVLSTLILFGLLFTYWKNYQSLKTGIGLGLIVFSLILLAKNLSMLYFHAMMVSYYNETVEFHTMVLESFEFVALAVLGYVTWKN